MWDETCPVRHAHRSQFVIRRRRRKVRGKESEREPKSFSLPLSAGYNANFILRLGDHVEFIMMVSMPPEHPSFDVNAAAVESSEANLHFLKRFACYAERKPLCLAPAPAPLCRSVAPPPPSAIRVHGPDIEIIPARIRECAFGCGTCFQPAISAGPSSGRASTHGDFSVALFNLVRDFCLLPCLVAVPIAR